MSVWTHLIPQPPPTGCTELLGEARHIGWSSASNVWITVENPSGGIAPSSGSPTIKVFQWDGTQYNAHHYTYSGGTNVNSRGILVFATNNVWLCAGKAIAQWNGTTWIERWTYNSWGPIPKEAGSIAGTSSTDIWTACMDQDGLTDSWYRFHWTGTSWSVAVNLQMTTSINAQPPGTNNHSEIDRAGPLAVSTGSSYITFAGGDGFYWIAVPSAGSVSGRRGQQISFSGWLEAIKLKPSSSTYYVIGSRQDFGLGLTYPSLWSGALGSLGESDPISYYTDVGDPTDTNDLQMCSIDVTSSTDMIVCGKFINAGAANLVVDRMPASTGVWTHYDLKNLIFGGEGGLFGTIWISSTDAWVIGYYRCDTDNLHHTFVSHWNGTAWSDRPIPAGL